MFYLYGILAVFGYALTQVIAKKVQIDGNIPPMLFIAITMLVLFLLSSFGAIFFEKVDLGSISNSQWLWMIGFGIINFIAFVLLIISISGIPLAHYQMIGLLTPLIGGIFAYFWFGENLSTQFFLGFGLMSLGLIVALWK